MKTKPRQQKSKSPKIHLNNLPMIEADAAGIDIAHREHRCAVPPDRCEKPVRAFGTFTEDLEAMADWFAECGIKTVAMESTGVYWIPAFQVLERRGFTVRLVNARHVKNVSGRKSDVLDCQWLQRLQSYGLLNASFRPSDQMCVLRSYLRYRDELVSARSVQCLHMQKALQEMNVQLHQVLSNVTGVSGQRLIGAILAGERDPQSWWNWWTVVCRPAKPPFARPCGEITVLNISSCSSAPTTCIRTIRARFTSVTSR
jgi:hypothetical protein